MQKLINTTLDEHIYVGDGSGSIEHIVAVYCQTFNKQKPDHKKWSPDDEYALVHKV